MASRPTRSRRYDLTTLIGVPLGVGMILAGQMLEGGNAWSLVQSAAALIVLGGTLGAVLVSFPLDDVKQAGAGFKRIWVEDGEAPEATIAAILRYAKVARKDGILALEDESARAKDPLLRKGLMLAVDGVNPKTLREMLEIDLAAAEERDVIPARVFESAGGYAPTVGILGAVLGLIHVMDNLSDPTRLGSGIAVAFVATIYGVGLANLLLLPIANKLRRRADESSRRRVLLFEGILAIQEGLNPRLIDQKLRGFTDGEPAARHERGGKAA
jgi:chemotaxis protein MotA